MRLVLIHTATSPIPDRSPSYTSGWGLINAAKAAATIAANPSRLSRVRVPKKRPDFELAKLNAKTASEPLALSIAWIDEPLKGTQIDSAIIDDRSSKLVQKMAISAVSPSGKVYYPWKLDPNAPSRQATRSGLNWVDNAQRIDIATGEAGVWRLLIDASRLTRDMHVAVIHSGFAD